MAQKASNLRAKLRRLSSGLSAAELKRWLFLQHWVTIGAK